MYAVNGSFRSARSKIPCRDPRDPREAQPRLRGRLRARGRAVAVGCMVLSEPEAALAALGPAVVGLVVWARLTTLVKTAREGRPARAREGRRLSESGVRRPRRCELALRPRATNTGPLAMQRRRTIQRRRSRPWSLRRHQRRRRQSRRSSTGQTTGPTTRTLQVIVDDARTRQTISPDS